MRCVRPILLALVAACLLLAQAPIGFGPGTLSPGLLDLFDWYTATASGCTEGARGMCVGQSPQGDTMYFTGWFADASMLPVKTGLPVVGTLNDFTSKTCSGNIAVIQLAAFSWTARNASRIYEVNCMDSYGNNPGGTDTPAGWKGHCTSSDDGTQGCSWKSRSAFVRDGLLYLPVERQIPSGTPSIHDATLIMSADGGKTWKNPYTVAHGGVASATGDAPRCGAPTGASPCTDVSYPGSIMWPGLPNGLYAWQVVQYGQDGVTPPAGINDGCDPAIYTCFIGDPLEGSLARVRNTDLPSLDVRKWQYYTCRAITDTYRCPGSDPASWTSNFADRTSTGPPIGKMWSFPMAYLKEFKSYLLAGATATSTIFATAPAIQGPWEPVANNEAVTWGFTAPTIAVGYEVVSTTPPHVKLTVVGDTPAHTSQTTPLFAQWDLVLGRIPMMQGGENPRYNNVGGISHAGYILTESHATGTIPRKDLDWAFDLYDHGGNTAPINSVGFGTRGFHDIANGSAYLSPCSGSVCGDFNPGQGIALKPYGMEVYDAGYLAHTVTVQHETPQTIAIAAAHPTTGGLTPVNAPTAMQGNGTFTVAGVFRYNVAGFNQVPLWFTGDNSGTNTGVALSYSNNGGTNLELGWGVSANRWRYNSGFSLVPGNWYFIACTVEANESTPIAHMWIGIGGSIVDKIKGVTRSSTGGNPVQTPNVAAAPLLLGAEPGNTHTVSASYASLFVYSRALAQAEAGLMYETLKTKMAARGVVLQ